MFKRSLIFVHRWLGVAVSAVLMLWFSSGIVMMYHRFPELTERERLAHQRTLDPASIRISPEQAAQIVKQPGTAPVRITTFDGRPVYLFPGAVLYADTGTEQRTIDAAMIGRAAAAWSGQPLDQARSEKLTAADQWTIGAEFQYLFPMHKFSWPDGQQVYVQDENADIAQYTTASSRRWAYLGAIPHWLFFASLRRHSGEWFALIKWAAIIATASGVIGLAIGVWVYSPRRRYRHDGAPSRIPYRTWKRWHTVAGLVFGVITVTWSFSGLLSLGPFRFMDQVTAATVPSQADDEAVPLDRVLTGEALPLASYANKPPAQALASVKEFAAKDIDYVSLNGAPFYIASNGAAETRVIPVVGSPAASFNAAELMQRIRQAISGHIAELRLVTEYDRHYLDRKGELPLPVVLLRLNDAVGSRYYIDPRTASIVSSNDARGWIHRYLFHGLHSLNFPWLYKYRPLWDIVMITLLLGGAALCSTSVVLTIRVLTRKLQWVLSQRFQSRRGNPAGPLTQASKP